MPSATTTHENTAIQDSHMVDTSSSCSSYKTSSSMLRESTSTSTLPPAPPPMPPSCGLPPPPPPLLGGLRNPLRPESAPPSSRLTPRGGPDESSTLGQLPQQRTPLPKTQMKRLQWNKIPVNRVTSSPGNLWIEVAGMFNGYQLNFERMEELFANASNGGAPAVCSGGYNGSSGSKSFRELPVTDGSSGERKPKKMDEINLIDSKRSMNVNIFLRQFRTSNIDIVKCLRSGNSRLMGPERLRSLIKVLPEPEDVLLLSAFAGDRTQLGSAEKFYLELIALPNHRFLAESLLMKEEFSQTIDYVKPAIDAIILSARDIKDSKALHEILYTVLMAGNFLNSGVYSGNAAGFQLQSLLRLSELRANKPRMNLLHFVAQEIETNNPHLIDKLKKLKYLAEASHYSIEALLNDISTLQNRVRTISNQISIAEQHFQRQMKDFLEMALGEMEVLELDMRELEELRLEFAAYLCEDPLTFKLDDCLSTFNTFCKMFHKALEENKERHLQDLRAEERRQLREEQIASKRRSVTSDESQSRRSPDGSAMSSPDVDTIDSARQQRNFMDQRRIQISQKMPAFLIETSQDSSSRESSPCPAVSTTTTTAPNSGRHKKRNSMSNFFRNDSRKMLPQTPGGGECTSADDRDNELIDVLLKSASAAEESDRRPGSGSVRQRRRSRASIDILDRERAPSPSPLNVSVPHMDTVTDGGAAANGGKDQLDRGQPGRSSCPSRISSAQGRKQQQQLLKDALLNQHAASDANGTDGQTEESGGSCPSDAEVSAKQERENRRMERRRRSRVNSSISTSDAKSMIGGVEQSTSEPASGFPILSQSIGSDLNSANRIPGSQDYTIQQLSVRGKSATEAPRPIAVEIVTEQSSNLVTNTSSSSTDQFFEDVVQSRSTAIRRDAAKIRSLGDERRWSSELERPNSATQESLLSSSDNHETGSDAGALPTAGSMVKGVSEEHNINQTTQGHRRASAEQEAAVSATPPRKARLNNLVKQHSIAEQRISAGTKSSSGSHKNIANARGAQRNNENESKNHLGSQSDYRDSDENFTESTQLFDEKSMRGERMSGAQRLNVTVETERDGCATTKVDHGHHSEASALNSQDGCSSQGPNADDGDQQKRWGKVFENEETEDPDSVSRETRQSQAPDEERDQENNEEDGEDAEDRTKDSKLQSSAKVRDHGELMSGSSAVKRASTRKEKLRKLSQLYSAEDDVDDMPRTGHVGTENMEDGVLRVTEKPVTRTQSRESAEQRSDTDSSFYSARDDGFESEGHSLCSASQRTSMSSTAESDIRITPLMTRKTYPAGGGGEKEEVGADVETSALLLGRSSIESVISAARMMDTAATGVAPKPGDTTTRRTSSAAANRSLAKPSTSRSTLGGSRELHTADKTGVRKGLSKAIERPRGPATHIAAAAASVASRMLPKSVASPRSVATNAVQYRIAKPNMVAVSRTPTPRTVKTTYASASPAATKQNPTSAGTMGKSPTKTETKPKAAAVATIRRHENRVTPAVTIAATGEKGRTQERPVQSPAFVRGVGVRATVPADVLRENKKAAIESRQVRNITTPTPPRRTTSLLDATNTPSTAAGAQKTGGVPVVSPRMPSASAAGLPAVDLSETRLDTSANEGKSSGSRKSSSERRMPLSSRSDRSKAGSRIQDSYSGRMSAAPTIGDGKLHLGVTTATAGMSRQSTATTPVVSVQAKVIHVATTRSKASSAVSERGKSRMPTAKTVSVTSLA